MYRTEQLANHHKTLSTKALDTSTSAISSAPSLGARFMLIRRFACCTHHPLYTPLMYHTVPYRTLPSNPTWRFTIKKVACPHPTLSKSQVVGPSPAAPL